MKLNHVRVCGVKGINAEFEVTRPNLCLIGPMGSGKSAVLDGIALALGLPTRYGAKALDRLSPTGQWRVVLGFDHPTVQRLGRELKRRGSEFTVNGRKVSAKEYDEAVRILIDVEPHHVSLNEFLGLSGQKRAEMFAQILEASENATIDAVCQKVLGVALDKFFDQRIGTDNMTWAAPTIESLNTLSGAAGELVDAMRQRCGEAKQRQADAKIRHEGLATDAAATLSHGMTPHEVTAKLSEVDQELGALRDKKVGIEAGRDQYESAQRVLEAARREAKTRADALKTACDVVAGRAEAQKVLDEIMTEQVRLKARVTEAGRDDTRCCRQREIAHDDVKGVRKSMDLIEKLFAAEWNIDADWLNEEFGCLLDKLDIQLHIDFTKDDPSRGRVVAFAREVVQEALGGDSEKLKQSLEDAQSREAAGDQKIKASASALQEAQLSVSKAENNRQEAAAFLSHIDQVRGKMLEVEKLAEEAERSRAELEQSASRLAVPVDDEALDGQIVAAEEKRSGIARQSSELSQSMAISGQVEKARVEVAATGAILDCLNELMLAVQQWRDDHVASAMGDVMAPFQERFSKLFGEPVELTHHRQGSGRSTEFNFMVRRGSEVAPLDLLSDGESVLAAAAFLSALQSINDGPGSILMLNDIGLDMEGVRLFLRGAPQLGLDFVGLATSQLSAEADVWNLSNTLAVWQVVEMKRK